MSFSNMPASLTFYSGLCVVSVGLVLIGTGHPGACVEVRGCRVSPSTAWKWGTRDRTVVIRLEQVLTHGSGPRFCIFLLFSIASTSHV